jgi:hypothetical protein
MNDYFLSTDFTPAEILNDLYDEMTNGEFYLSPANVLRCDLSNQLKEKLKNIINLPIADCGFLKTKPLQNYPVHKDIFRLSAINMPMFDPAPYFFSYVFDGKQYHSIEYKKDYFTILNVMQFHGVRNLNNSMERNVLSIGFKDISYSKIVDKFQKKELFNYVI